MAQTVSLRYELQRIHPYRFKDTLTGEILTPPGVTSITGLLSKDAIPQWAANEAAKTAIELKGVLEDSEVYDIARKRYITLRDDAADGGTQAHKWIEDYLNDNLKPYHYFESEASINIVKAFLRWEQEHPFDSHIAEQVLFSPTHYYAGTRDDLAFKDVYWTIDFKTGNPDFEYDERQKRYSGLVRPYSAHLMQCAGYDIAEEETSGIKSEFYGIVYLLKDPSILKTKYGLEPRPYLFFKTENTIFWRRQFLDARDLYDSDLNNNYEEIV